MEVLQPAKGHPHTDFEAELYYTYKGGWYSGYSAWLVLEMALPLSELGRIAKSSPRLQTAVNTLDSSGDLRRAAATLESALSTAYSPVRYVNYGMSRAITLPTEASVKAGEHLLTAGVTAGSRFRLASAWSRADVEANDIESASREAREVGGKG